MPWLLHLEKGVVLASATKVPAGVKQDEQWELLAAALHQSGKSWLMFYLENQHKTDVALMLESPNGMVFQTSVNKMKGETNQMALGHSSKLFTEVFSTSNCGEKENAE